MAINYNPKIVTDGLVLCLDASNPKSYSGTGNTVYDLTNSHYDFTLTNGATTNTINKIVFSFDGSDDYLNTTLIPSTFWNAGSWSVSLWAYFNSVNKGTDNGMIGHGTQATNNGLHLGERNGRIYFGFFANDLQSNVVLEAQKWYNIVWTFNFVYKLKQIYLNSVFQTSGGTVGYFGDTTDSRIGNYVYNATSDMNGFLNNILFYNKVLSQNEIRQNFNANRGKYNI